MARKINLSPIFKIILIVLTILVLSLLCTFVIVDKVKSNRFTKESQAAQARIEGSYQELVSKKTDPFTLVKNGNRLLETNLPSLAIINFRQAIDLQNNYRDGWLALGLAELNLGDLNGALDSFQTAEKIDPICVKTYEFLKFTYEKLEDVPGAQKAEEKLKFLTKK